MSRASGADGGRVVVRPDGEEGAPGTGTLGITVFLVSLGVLFGAGIVAYLVIRARADEWPPPGSPELPGGLWVSTLLLLAGSAAVQRALGEIRRGNQSGLQRALAAALGLALLFTVSQAASWVSFLHGDVRFLTHLYGFTFFMLTGLHALHIVGGIVGLAVVLGRARSGAYSWAHYPGVRYCTIYWHFLGAVWIVLFALLLLGS